MAEVFISYSRRDKEFARRLGDALVARERNAWADWKDIPLTSEWQQEILRNIEAADAFLFIISPDSVASINCRKEIDHAALNHKKMLPLYYRPVPDAAVPETLARFQRLNFDTSEVFDDGVEALIVALETDLGWTQEHTRLLTRAKEWERLGSDPSFLLRGKDLREAEQWMAKSSDREPKPTALQSQYILASRQAAIRTQRIIIGAVAAAFVVAVGLAIYAFLQRNVAQRETQVATANAAEAALQKTAADTNAEKADANALEATRQKNTAVKNKDEAVRQKGIAETETDKAVLQAKITNARRLATESLYRFSYKTEALAVSGALALESLQAYPTNEGMKALLQVLRLIPPAPRILHTPHRKIIDALAFSHDNRWLAIGGDDQVVIWNAVDQTEHRPLEIPKQNYVRGHVVSLAFSYDSRWLAAGSDGDLFVWEVETGKLAAYIRHADQVRSVAFSPSGEYLATTTYGEGAGRGVRLFRRGSHKWEELTPFPQGAGPLTRATFLKNGSLAVTDRSGVWITSPDFSASDHEKYGDGGACDAITLSADGSTLAALCQRGIVTAQLDEANYKFSPPIHVIDRGWGLYKSQISASATGDYIAVDDLIYSGRVYSDRNDTAYQLLGCGSVAFRPDGKAVAGSLDDGSVAFWPTRQGDQSLLVTGGAGAVSGLSISSDESLLVSVLASGTVTLFDISAPDQIRRLRQAEIGPDLQAVAFSPDARLLAVTAQNHLFLVDSRTLKIVADTAAHGQPIPSFSADSRLLMRRDDLGIAVFDTGTRKQKFTIKGRFDEIRLSPDGKYLAARAHFNPNGTHRFINQVGVWTLSNGRQAAWSEVGRQKTDGPAEQPPQSGEQSLLKDSGTWLSSPKPQITSPDGTWRIDSTLRSSVELQEADTKRPIATFEDYSGLTDAIFSPRGRWLATSSKDGSIHLWPLQVSDLATQACKLLPRNLTPEEWKDLKMDGPYHKACANLP